MRSPPKPAVQDPAHPVHQVTRPTHENNMFEMRAPCVVRVRHAPENLHLGRVNFFQSASGFKTDGVEGNWSDVDLTGRACGCVSRPFVVVHHQHVEAFQKGERG